VAGVRFSRSFAVISALFAMIFKMLARRADRRGGHGAAFTIYLGTSSIASSFGAAVSSLHFFAMNEITALYSG